MIVKRYQFYARTKIASSQINANFDDIIAAYNSHTHSNTGTDAPLITASGIAGGPSINMKNTVNPVKFHAYHNTTQSIAANAKVSYNTKDYDTGGNFDNVTNFRFTAPVNGFYFFDSGLYLQSVTTASLMTIDFYKNGTSYARAAFFVGRGDDAQVHGSMQAQLVAGDYIEVFRGGTNTFTGYGQASAPAHGFNYFAGHLIAAT